MLDHVIHAAADIALDDAEAVEGWAIEGAKSTSKGALDALGATLAMDDEFAATLGSVGSVALGSTAFMLLFYLGMSRFLTKRKKEKRGADVGATVQEMHTDEESGRITFAAPASAEVAKKKEGPQGESTSLLGVGLPRSDEIQVTEEHPSARALHSVTELGAPPTPLAAPPVVASDDVTVTPIAPKLPNLGICGSMAAAEARFVGVALDISMASSKAGSTHNSSRAASSRGLSSWRGRSARSKQAAAEEGGEASAHATPDLASAANSTGMAARKTAAIRLTLPPVPLVPLARLKAGDGSPWLAKLVAVDGVGLPDGTGVDVVGSDAAATSDSWRSSIFGKQGVGAGGGPSSRRSYRRLATGELEDETGHVSFRSPGLDVFARRRRMFEQSVRTGGAGASGKGGRRGEAGRGEEDASSADAATHTAKAGTPEDDDPFAA